MRLMVLLALLLALPTPARAGGFDAVAEGAERLDELGTFLDRYIGRCTDRYEKQRCEANVAQVRKEASGARFTIRVTDAASLVRAQRKGAGYVLLFTPFIDGGGMALTHGAPVKQDAAGRPIVNIIPIPAALPDGMMEMEFETPFRTGAIELEIVFRPEKVWKMARRGELGSYEGVAARFLGVRIMDARSGAEIASRTL